MATVADLLQRHNELSPASDTALLDTELLLCHSLSVDRAWLKTWPDKILSAPDMQRFEQLFRRRLEGEPVAFIIGSQGFWTLDLKVSPHTLIPRPETELLVETAMQLELPNNSQVLDLGTGTGAIALALASEYPQWQMTAVDVQASAVELAEQNRLACRLKNVTIYQSDWFAAVANRQPQTLFNLIVSNPPYIEIDDAHLFEGDVRFEPASALVSGTQGLDDLQLVIGQSSGFLAPAGWLLVEHGHAQGLAVRDLFNEAGYVLVETRQDYNQLDRITLGRLAD
ncbi:peptide chain release factor N(5)-glutamine methyltransferase [SAR92 clade bacterium H231]|jgi:release factor glutamine methyltransferase|nr:peptide chain release factor N(5)-glutamine methyltransferase [Porticoccaceae bacterium]MCT2532509.1 peptide chain release factor N(5)-glutamine methyltransferase [SAR92 clade bacterium H231]MBT6320037.1 peptide chain release factor N(5)-glutamine methyltransferase [Porticoccaceae bacterium]MDA8735688.1 peptide chain release factor N(5)-glutamine methyltransferase [Porticoccaceae bacterium]MDA8903392.1 peptide chain release factor N(5)-glutamine methyltransferase [Porticoccaceae bacterium]